MEQMAFLICLIGLLSLPACTDQENTQGSMEENVSEHDAAEHVFWQPPWMNETGDLAVKLEIADKLLEDPLNSLSISPDKNNSLILGPPALDASKGIYKAGFIYIYAEKSFDSVVCWVNEYYGSEFKSRINLQMPVGKNYAYTDVWYEVNNTPPQVRYDLDCESMVTKKTFNDSYSFNIKIV